jgi:hypothetical protein
VDDRSVNAADTASKPSQFDPGFPITLARLREIYSGVTFPFEFHRSPFADVLSGNAGSEPYPAFESALTADELPPPRPVPELLQRYFYWSATCFYRSFYLMLAYLGLDRKAMNSWAHVTAYYSRFYMVKALLNLFLANIVSLKTEGPKAKRQDVLIYTSMEGVKSAPAQRILNSRGSHQMWWSLFSQMQYAADFPDTDEAHFALSDAYYNAKTRNEINYSDRYLEGFPELEWFDTSAIQMFSHLDMWRPRSDRDITDIDSFFDGTDPESADSSAFYGDEGQIVWVGVRVYLEILRATGVKQGFITREKMFGLLERFGEKDYPTISARIRRAVEECLPA